jgi:hypothetical protein
MVRNYYDDEIDSESTDYIKNAQEELKRVEHQVYVTLKYTRTADVLMNVVLRMIASYEAMINAVLQIQGFDQEAIDQFPLLEKVKKVESLYNEPQVIENMQVYLLLRKISKAKNVQKEFEYRRPVAMITIINGKEVKVDIDLVTHYYAVLISFYKYVETLNKSESNV